MIYNYYDYQELLNTPSKGDAINYEGTIITYEDNLVYSKKWVIATRNETFDTLDDAVSRLMKLKINSTSTIFLQPRTEYCKCK